MEVELQEQRSGSANETPRSGGTEVRTIEAKDTYQNIGRMAQGEEVGVVTGMIPECSWRVWRCSGVSGVRVRIHGYDSWVRKKCRMDWVRVVTVKAWSLEIHQVS